MAAKIYINLPVKDIGRSVDFFCQLGFSPNALFSDEKSACLVVTQEIAVMLLKKEYFQTFTNKPIANTKENNELILSIAVESRAKVDELFNTALAAGAQPVGETQDEGWLYGRGFADLDGHLWEFHWMDDQLPEA